MKKTLIILTLVILSAAAGLYASDLAPRDLSSPSRALVGQWSLRLAPDAASGGAQVRYFFGPIQAQTGRGEYIRQVADAQVYGTYQVLSQQPGERAARLRLEAPDSDALVLGQGLTIKLGQTSLALPNGERLELKPKLQERALTLSADGRQATLEAEALIVRYGAQRLDYINARTTPAAFSWPDLVHRVGLFGRAASGQLQAQKK